MQQGRSLWSDQKTGNKNWPKWTDNTILENLVGLFFEVKIIFGRVGLEEGSDFKEDWRVEIMIKSWDSRGIDEGVARYAVEKII